jgi:hypothetical protein
MTRAASDTKGPAKRARHAVKAALESRGWQVSASDDDGVAYLEAKHSGDRTIRVRVKARTKGTWQATVTSGAQHPAQTDVPTFWAFVDLSIQPLAIYLAPDRWMRRDIYDAHQAYLRRHGGRRARNIDSNHHAIALDRIEQWFNAWGQLDDSPVSQIWALCANPTRYRIREAVAHLELDFWLTGKSKIRLGDKVVIWQTRDHDGRRGILALGEVVGEAQVRSDEGNPYWQDRHDGSDERPRVTVRYQPIPRPLWIDNSDDGVFIASLAVAKAKGGTVFRVQPDEWKRIQAIAGVRADESSVVELEASIRRPASRQGFGLSVADRKAVESHAMRLATQYFSQQWEAVTDVSLRCSFDLLCQSADRELRVEVKGTTSLGEQVLLTRREVEEAKSPGYALFVVSEIRLGEGDPVSASGGIARVIHDWDLTRHLLTPIAYSVGLDWSTGQTIDFSEVAPSSNRIGVTAANAYRPLQNTVKIRRDSGAKATK